MVKATTRIYISTVFNCQCFNVLKCFKRMWWSSPVFSKWFIESVNEKVCSRISRRDLRVSYCNRSHVGHKMPTDSRIMMVHIIHDNVVSKCMKVARPIQPYRRKWQFLNFAEKFETYVVISRISLIGLWY